MPFFQTYAKEFVALLVPFLTWFINRIFRAKAKLLLATPHSYTFLVPQPLLDEHGKTIKPTQTVYTASYHLKNAGTETARNVEVVFNWKPPCLNFWPIRHATEHLEKDDRFVLIFESLAPGEMIGFELLSLNFENPDLTTARCEQCMAQNIQMLPQPVAKPWQKRAAIILILVGLGSSIYLMLLLLQFLILKTPFNF